MIAIIYKGLHTHIIFGQRVNKTHFVPLFGTVRQFNHYQVRELNHIITKIDKNSKLVDLKNNKLFENIYRKVISITNTEYKVLGYFSNISDFKTRITKTNIRKYDSFLATKYIGYEGSVKRLFQFVDYDSNINIVVYSNTKDEQHSNLNPYYIKKRPLMNEELLSSGYIIDLTNSILRTQINSLITLLDFKAKKVIEDFTYNMTVILLNSYNPDIFTY